MVLDIAIIAFLMSLAIFLLILEIFFLPGITIAGIASLIFAVGGVIYAYAIGNLAGHITLAASIVVFASLFVWMARGKSLKKIALNTDIDSKLDSVADLGIKPGDEGLTTSRLAPIGKAKFNNVTVEAKSTGEFINENVRVVALRVDGYNVVVATQNIIPSPQ
jgi:membrane-bound ClpP family serine protease